MHDYLLTTEVVRFAFVLGIAVSMLLYERRHVTTGSIVVPGYIATFIVSPTVIAATFANAFVSYAIVNRLLRRWFLLYGRTKFTVLAIVSILIQTAMLKLTPSGPWLWESDVKLIVGVGYVIPALIAHDMGRQGIRTTTTAVLLSAAIVATPIALALLVGLPGINDLSPLQGYGEMAIDAAWIPVAVLLSALAGWGVAHNYCLRSGGFVGAAFVGMLLGDPWQVAIMGAVGLVTYLIVTRLLMDSMILFGRRKFSAMLLVSSTLSWLLLWVGADLVGIGAERHFDLGALALTPLFVPGLLANDAQRSSLREVVIGVSVATTFVVSATWCIQSLAEGTALATWWRFVAVGSLAAIFWRQLLPARVRRTRRSAARTAAATAAAVAADHLEPSDDDHWARMHPEAIEAAEHWLAEVMAEIERSVMLEADADTADHAVARHHLAAPTHDAHTRTFERTHPNVEEPPAPAAVPQIPRSHQLAHDGHRDCRHRDDGHHDDGHRDGRHSDDGRPGAAPPAVEPPRRVVGRDPGPIGDLPRAGRPARPVGEFDVVASGLAASVRRPADMAPGADDTDRLDRAVPPQAARVHPDAGPVDISGSSGDASGHDVAPEARAGRGVSPFPG